MEPVHPGETVTVHMPALGRVRGRIDGDAGARAEGVRVVVRGEGLTVAQRLEGRDVFVAEGLVVPGRYQVRVVADGGASARAEVELGAGVEEAVVRLDLRPPRRVTGRLVDTEGRPRAGVPVGETLTGPDGRFAVVVPVDTGPLLLWDRAAGRPPRRLALPPGDERVDLGDVVH